MIILFGNHGYNRAKFARQHLSLRGLMEFAAFTNIGSGSIPAGYVQMTFSSERRVQTRLIFPGDFVFSTVDFYLLATS